MAAPPGSLDTELAEAEIISSCTQPSLPYTHNTNNARLSHSQMSPHKCGSLQHAVLALISVIWDNQVSFAAGSSPLMRGERI